MLKILFSGDDIARTRVAPAPDPLWELTLSLHLLQGRGRYPLMAGWRRTVSQRLRREVGLDQLRLLFALNRPRGYFPDFLTPIESVHGLDAGLEAVRATPVTALHRDLTVLAGETTLPSWAGALARGDGETLTQLVDSMRRYESIALGPYRSHLRAAVEADRNRRARALLDGGAEGLLAGLRPHLRWESGVLEVRDYPRPRELHLGGRGLLLVPSYFCGRTPVALFDEELTPVLVYPVDRLGGLTSPDPVDRAAGPDRQALAALLGRTRAAVLEVTDSGCTTGELARRLRISPAAASQHTTVLRNAGLLVSQRERNTVLHTLTPLGRAMLNR
ncbi:ArsR/SmtB family transcription factor [Micromonospora echinofusca]|uniref:Helix-turn-helix domain-containing protein n=1 Tax=Micromonospora echinofusca TaxID=47858 RepID=A0ABS3VZ10_MICEH|nr:winged helix-turn-helix domain-containing protein [Micromonospora echinofusca]MBO4209762.1 helix-turn-helix domain-containing protein [Micromonospora echinofusca]